MFKLNLKIALRTLWKSKGYTLINIFGLSIGMAGFIMILLFANYEYSYDTWNPNASNVYRLTIKDAPDEEEYSSTPAELAPALKEVLPEIQYYARYYIWDSYQRLVSKDGNEAYVDNILGVDSSWFNVFPYKFIFGDATNSLLSKDQIVISRKTSEHFFGKKNPVGESLLVNNKKRYIISGVFQEPSTPEHLNFDGFIKKSSSGDGWGNGNFFTYIQVKQGTNTELIREKINKSFQTLPILKDRPWLKTAQLIITPVTDIYLHSKSVQDPAKRGNADIVTILILFSTLLLLISCINFTNLSISQSVKRAKETGVRKVLGASRKNLITYFLTETTIQCLVALLFALVLVELGLPALNNLMDMQLTLLNYKNPAEIGIQLSLVVLMVILLSGGYASFFLSSYEPVKVLKGNFSRGIGSLWMRKALLSIQFIVAGVFMIALMIIRQQVDYIKNKDVGFNKDHVLVFKIRDGHSKKNFEQIKQRLLKVDGVSAVSRVNYFPGVKEMQVVGREFNGVSVQNLSIVTVDFDYFKVMGIAPQIGRVFSTQYGTDSLGVVVNESAVKKYGLQKGVGQKWIDDLTVIGVVKDYVQKGMESAPEPTAFIIERAGTNGANNVIVKIAGAHVQQTLAEVKRLWEAAEPFPFQYTWLDQSFAKVYVQYVRLDKLFNVFTYLTLSIAVIGLFAMASFTVQERTKEIGIRKVLGAETVDIMQMVNKSFILIVLLANLIAIPVAYILLNGWLSGFAYRTTITAWPFIITFVVSIFITLLTVSIQAYRTASAKPLDALRYE
jgi:putative ABC transport system permease protein